MGFPGGPLVKNLPVNAEDMSSTPDPGRSHMPWGKTKPVHHNYGTCILEPVSHNKGRQHDEKLVHCN